VSEPQQRKPDAVIREQRDRFVGFALAAASTPAIQPNSSAGL
jgi:hypothetical protein